MANANDFEYYNEVVQPIYIAYSTASQGSKLENVERSIQQGMKLIAETHQSGISQDDKARALEAAENHFVEAGLSASRQLALLMFEKAKSIASTKERMKWSARAPKEQVAQDWKSSKNLYTKATEEDKKTIIVTQKKEVVELFKQSAECNKKWIDLFDQDLLDEFKFFSFKHHIKQNTVGFMVATFIYFIPPWSQINSKINILEWINKQTTEKPINTVTTPAK